MGQPIRSIDESMRKIIAERKQARKELEAQYRFFGNFSWLIGACPVNTCTNQYCECKAQRKEDPFLW